MSLEGTERANVRARACTRAHRHQYIPYTVRNTRTDVNLTFSRHKVATERVSRVNLSQAPTVDILFCLHFAPYA